MATGPATSDKTNQRPAGGGPRRQSRRTESPSRQAEGLRAFLYDSKAPDKEVELSEHLAQRLRQEQLLWVDVDTSSSEAITQLRALVDVAPDDLARKEGLPIHEQGEYFSFTLPALRSAGQEAELTDLSCLVAQRWVVTAHAGGLAFLDAFDAHVREDSSLGELDGPSFLASLLEWELNEYFLAIEAVQKQIDRIDESILAEKLNEHSLDRLVHERRRITYLRGGLTPHRYVYATLAHASFDVISGTDASSDYALLGERLEQAVQATDGARQMMASAVDLYMTRTAQRTNEVVKVLTVVSVLLLPASLMAGIFGMNMLPHALLHSWIFGIIIAAMVAVSGSILATLYRRGWL